ncbi:Elongation factor 4 [Quillaja saponaria]|uniref:Elongation factor 4 n=1 Tax=Quillaja saponaria TaxID=32244 RepID=A0AAD7LPC5_QUISA|nr:Elongation factor 4 [Quillaja saponaria]
MVPDLELKVKLEDALDMSAGKENVIVPVVPESKDMPHEFNHEINAHGTKALFIETTALSNENEDVEVDITDFARFNVYPVEAVQKDVTESSSSFGDTESQTENGPILSDTEVESQLNTGNESSLIFEGWCEPFRIRKRKLTVGWRRFSRSLMWRCKWIELRLKQLQSQALKYDKELAAYDHRKQIEFEKFTVDGSNTKSVPFLGQSHRDKIMKRKKRKRVEEMFDIKSYMSNHNLFSFYEDKNFTGRASLEDYHGDLVNATNCDAGLVEINDMWPSSLGLRDNDNLLEEVIQKLEEVHSHVQKLKTRMDKVVSENPKKFSSVINCLLPCDGLTRSDQDLAFASDGEVTPLFDIFQTTEQPRPVTEDGLLIQNEAANEELYAFEDVRSQHMEKPKELIEEQKTNLARRVSEPDLPSANAKPPVQSTMKSPSASDSSFPRRSRRWLKR